MLAGVLFAGGGDVTGDGGEIGGLRLLDAPFAAGQREQRADEPFLLLAEGQRLLAAKAAVIGAVTFAGGLAAAAIVVTAGPRILRDSGVYVFPVSMLTGARVVIGTAALLAASSVLALAAGALLRRSAAAVTAVIMLIVLPYLLTVVAPVLPPGPADWVLRITPAAAFSIQQVMPSYAQVSNVYTPAQGFFPLAPWAGLAVLCAWAALALASVRLRWQDA